MKITNHFRLLNSQGEFLSQENVDFINLHIDIDNPFFIDFNRIFTSNGPLALEMKRNLKSYISNLSKFVVTNNQGSLYNLLKGIHETNATCLGLSEGYPDGNSLGKILKNQVQEGFNDYLEIIKNGNFNLDTIFFTFPLIGADRISDIVTSIIIEPLALFTKEQCLLHGIPTHKILLKNVYNRHSGLWENKFFDLPKFEDKPRIFIPKNIISSESNLSGTFDKFIRLGFHEFFKNSPKYCSLMKSSNYEGPMTKKDFDEYIKSNNIRLKSISQILYKNIDSKTIANLIQDVRSSIQELTDEEIEIILNFKKAS